VKMLTRMNTLACFPKAKVPIEKSFSILEYVKTLF
jgi:hypothetical protein